MHESALNPQLDDNGGALDENPAVIRQRQPRAGATSVMIDSITCVA